MELQFDITKVNTNSSQLRPLKLLEYNQMEICNLLENEVNQKLFIKRIQNLVKKKFPERYFITKQIHNILYQL